VLKRAFFFVLVVSLLWGCGGASPTPVVLGLPSETAAKWPTQAWPTTTPENQGMDSALLADMLASIQSQELNVHSALVIRGGFLVAEAYFHPYQPGTKHAIFSCTKSFISALVGVASELGFIDDIETPVLDFFPSRAFANVDPRKRRMQLYHLLTMTSGLQWSSDAAGIAGMLASDDWVQHVLDLPMVAPPGEQFNYCSGCSHILSAIIQQASGMSTVEFARQYLFGPLGISDFTWMTDPTGIAGGGWGLELLPRDMAKLGLLYLRQGQWANAQILPTRWVQASVREQVAADEDLGYGYQWWIYPELGSFAAQGFGSQLIVVNPGLDLIAVFTAALADSAPLMTLVQDYVMSAVRSNDPLAANPGGLARLNDLIAEVSQP
jgi:CubicO group peptidase (beta-lactamase class C family)